MHRREVPLHSPCSQSFAAMSSIDEQRRWCSSCAHEVHDLSASSEDQARAVLREASQRRVCVRYVVGPEGHLHFAQSSPPIEPDRLARRPRVSRFALAVSLVSITGCAGQRPMTIEPASDPPALPIADQDTLMGMVVMVPKDHFVDPLVYELRDEIIPESISRHGRR